MYSLENKTYYRVKVPFFNNFKSSSGCIISAKRCMDEFAEKYKTHSCNESFNSFKTRYAHDNDTILKWCEENADRLQHMQNLIKKLKQSSDMEFYSNALIVGYGIAYHALNSCRIMSASYDISIVSSYILDFPEAAFFDGLKKFNDGGGYDFFIKYLPTVFTTWPDICQNASPEEKAQYTDYACTLFEFIMYRAAFSFFCCTSREHKEALGNMILCYYKWLKTKKIYLPEKLQAMVFKFPYFN